MKAEEAHRRAVESRSKLVKVLATEVVEKILMRIERLSGEGIFSITWSEERIDVDVVRIVEDEFKFLGYTINTTKINETTFQFYISW